MVQYDNYIYNGVVDNNRLNENNNYYRYDSNKLHEMIAKREYRQAAKYLENFRFVGADARNANTVIRNKIEELNSKARRIEQLYGNASPEQYEAIDFYQNIYNNGGSEYLTGVEYTDEHGKRHLGNIYSNDYGVYKRALGSSDTEEANSIRIEFQPEERSGLFGLDRLRKDGYNSYKSFLKNNGYFTEEDLQDIVTIGKDGKAIITIDKGDKRFNKLMDVLYNFTDSTDGWLSRPSHYVHEGGKPFFNVSSNHYDKTYDYVVEKHISNKSNTNKKITIQGLNKDGRVIENGNIQAFYEMEDLITKAYNAQGETIRNLQSQKKDFTTTIAGAVFDGLEQLNEQVNNGVIDEKTYNREYKKYYGDVESVIQGLGSAHLQMYSNFSNEEPTDELLVEADNITRGEIVQEISKRARQDISYTTMLANGQIGTLITLKAKEPTKQNPNGKKRIQVFIPGLFHEQNQEKINRNTQILATQEVNDMINYGYNYDLDDDSVIRRDKIGNFYHDNTPISKEQAINLINKSIIIKRGSNKLLDEHINRNGEFVNEDLYEQKAMAMAMAASNELSPDVFYKREDGTEINPDTMTLEELQYIFDKKAIGQEPKEEEADNMSDAEYRKYKDLYYIFDHIMSAMNVYKYKYNR